MLLEGKITRVRFPYQCNVYDEYIVINRGVEIKAKSLAPWIII